MTPTRLLLGQITIVFAIVIGAVWGATQWAAAALENQPRLGPPWFEIAGWKVYLPWRLFEWWYAYEAYAPNVFHSAGLIAASGGIAGVAVAIVGSLWRARQNQIVTTYGSARWASPSEIFKSGLADDKGVFLGKFKHRYLRHDGSEHVMCFAPTRSGKGIGLVIPTLLTWPHSAVIHDIKGENWQLTAGWRSRFSHCLFFNPTDPASTKYNPLLEVRKGPSEVRDVQNIADILVDPEGALERRNHWEKTSHSLLVGVILHVLYAEEKKTLAQVATVLSDPKHSFEHTLRRMMRTNHLGTDETPKVHPVVAEAARELLNKSENERSGVLSTAMSFLGLYRDPTIAETTSACEWRIADLKDGNHPVSLYLVIPPSDISRTKPLVRLILNQIGRRLTERLEGDGIRSRQHPILMMLDEFPALGRLDFFESALAFLAGYGVRSFLIAQSLNQISKAYGENNSILDNCHLRIAFATNDERTAKRISDSLGTATGIARTAELCRPPPRALARPCHGLAPGNGARPPDTWRNHAAASGPGDCHDFRSSADPGQETPLLRRQEPFGPGAAPALPEGGRSLSGPSATQSRRLVGRCSKKRGRNRRFPGTRDSLQRRRRRRTETPSGTGGRKRAGDRTGTGSRCRSPGRRFRRERCRTIQGP